MSGKKVERNSGARVVGIEQGGTGAATASGALAALGAVPSALMAKPLGCISLDKDGRASPADLGLSVAGQPAVVGPQEIAYGSRVNYVITNFDSFLNYDVRAVAGSVTLRDDVIEYTAPPASSGLSKGGFTVGGRTYEIAFSVARVAKPVITWPTEGYSITANDSNPTAKLSAFSVSGGNAVKTGELQGKGSTVLTTGQNNGNRTIRFVGRGGAGYMLGGIAVKGQDAVIRQNGAPIATFPGGLGVTAPLTNLNGIPFTEGMQVSFDIPDSNEIKYFVYDEAGVLATTEWQVATTPDFSAPIVSTGAVTNFNAGLPLNFAMTKGQRYYVRARQAGLDGTISEWSSTVSFYYQYEAGGSSNLYKFHSKVNLLDHPLGYGTDTKQIDVLQNGYAFAKGYATVWQDNPLSVNWNYRNDFAPSTVGGKPRAIGFVDFEDGDGELLLLESPDSLQGGMIGKLRYGGAHVPSQFDAEIDANVAAVDYEQPFYPGVLWRQTAVKDVPLTMAISQDGRRVFTMQANERHVQMASRSLDGPRLKEPYRYQSWVPGSGGDYVGPYLNFASMFDLYAINRTNWKDHPADSSLFAQKYEGAYNYRRRRYNANVDMNTRPNLMVGQIRGLTDPDNNQVIVVAPRRSWRETYNEAGQVVSGEKGCDVVVTTFMQNGSGNPVAGVNGSQIDLLLHTLNGRMDGKRVPNTRWEATLSKSGNRLFIADIDDYSGRGVLSIYRAKSAAYAPFKKQKYSGSLTFQSIEQQASQGYVGPAEGNAVLAFSGNAMMGVPTSVKVKRTITQAGSTYQTTETFYLDEFTASVGVEAPVTNFNISVTYVNSSADSVYERGDTVNNPVRLRYTGALTVGADPDYPTELFGSHWELTAVIAGDPSGMRGFGQQLATDYNGTILVVGYQDTNAANAVRYRVYENASFTQDMTVNTKQAISVAERSWLRTAASAGVTMPVGLQRNNDVAFAPNSNLGVTGISPKLRYKKDGVNGEMSITTIAMTGDQISVIYRDASNGATATYSNRLFTLQNYKQLATISPSFADGNCVGISNDGNRVFVGKAGAVEVFRR